MKRADGSPASRRSRRGFIYVYVMGVSALLFTVALAAIYSIRITRISGAQDTDFAEARLYARSGLELGMHYISTDPYWRTHKGNGAWATNVAIGRGSFSLWAVDPVDNDVTVGDNHPVVLTATGFKGSAACKMSVRLEVGVKMGSCLEVSLCSDGDCSIANSTLTSDQTISTNGQMSTGGGGAVNANVEWYKALGGSGYNGSVKRITYRRVLPDPVHVFDSYLATGTPLSYLALPKATQPELIVNTDFETDVSGWYVQSGAASTKLTQDGAQSRGGAYSMKVSGRKSVSDVAAQDLPLTSMVQGHTYALKMSILTNALVPVQATLTLLNSAGTTFAVSTPAVTPVAGTWCDLQGSIIPTWSGTLTKATLALTTTSKSSGYNMDKVSLKDITFDNNVYYIDRTLLSPTSNPYGAANASGIYVLDCGGKDVVITNSRVVGTLVVINPGPNGLIIQNSINWEPATPNYPAIVCSGKLAMQCTSSPLDEASLNVNFDPVGCPYPYAGGISNATNLDTYPTQITGIVYAAKDITFDSPGNNAVAGNKIVGNLTGDGKIIVKSGTLGLTYSNLFYNNPPPGFDVGRVPMNPVPGTWTRTAP